MARNDTNVTGWTGWVFFAGFMMILAGILEIISGFTALLNNKFLLVGKDQLLLLNFTTWGWIHLLTGLIVLIAGFSVLHGAAWARAVGVVLATFSIVANLAYVNTYPIWSIAIMVVDVLVIYSLTVHGGEVRNLE